MSDKRNMDLEKISKAELWAENIALKQHIAELELRIAKLEKNSSNSSKPPSSDIVKPKAPNARKGKRHIGGQPGHPKHDRTPFAAEEIDNVQEYTLKQCPHCGGHMEEADIPPRIIQQVELVEKPVRIEEHRAYGYWCPHCRKFHYAVLPEEVKRSGLAGPRLTALAAYLKGASHASYSTIQGFFRDVIQTPLSRGHIAKLIAKVSGALDDPYAELLAALPKEARLNVDETGHKEKGDPFWTWCFRAATFTLFKIDPSRGSKVLIEVLGKEFNGVIGCDYFSAYRKYMRGFDVTVQFCLAHLIRDVKFLTTLPDRVTANYGKRLLKRLRSLFRIIHRREKMTEEKFQSALEREREKLVATAKRAPERREAQNMAERFRKYGKAYFEFITTPGIEPTNNLAEQAIRFIVIDRKVTQGTRSEKGRRWSERIWTTMATCRIQGRSAFEYLLEAVGAYFRGEAAPSLLFDSS